MQKTVGLDEFYIKDSWNFKDKINNLNIPKNVTIISLDIVSMYTNDNNIYKQINGLPMVSPLSATLANIVMEEAETKIINELTYYIKFTIVTWMIH